MQHPNQQESVFVFPPPGLHHPGTYQPEGTRPWTMSAPATPAHHHPPPHHHQHHPPHHHHHLPPPPHHHLPSPGLSMTRQLIRHPFTPDHHRNASAVAPIMAACPVPSPRLADTHPACARPTLSSHRTTHPLPHHPSHVHPSWGGPGPRMPLTPGPYGYPHPAAYNQKPVMPIPLHTGPSHFPRGTSSHSQYIQQQPVFSQPTVPQSEHRQTTGDGSGHPMTPDKRRRRRRRRRKKESSAPNQQETIDSKALTSALLKMTNAAKFSYDEDIHYEDEESATESELCHYPYNGQLSCPPVHHRVFKFEDVLDAKPFTPLRHHQQLESQSETDLDSLFGPYKEKPKEHCPNFTRSTTVNEILPEDNEPALDTTQSSVISLDFEKTFGFDSLEGVEEENELVAADPYFKPRLSEELDDIGLHDVNIGGRLSSLGEESEEEVDGAVLVDEKVSFIRSEMAGIHNREDVLKVPNTNKNYSKKLTREEKARKVQELSKQLKIGLGIDDTTDVSLSADNASTIKQPEYKGYCSMPSTAVEQEKTMTGLCQLKKPGEVVCPPSSSLHTTLSITENPMDTDDIAWQGDAVELVTIQEPSSSRGGPRAGRSRMVMNRVSGGQAGTLPCCKMM